MKLYEAMQLYEDSCIDTADDIFDCIVTIDFEKDCEPKSNYEKFCYELYKKVEFVKFFDGAYAKAICKWSSLVKDNQSVFEDFVRKNWQEKYQYVLDDVDELQYEWVEQFHLLLSGQGTEEDYKIHNELLEKCK